MVPELTTKVISPLPWHRRLWSTIDDLVCAGRMPHALMLAGPEEIGKTVFARAIAQRLLCTTPLGAFACGQCKQCLLYAAGNHPDFLCLFPEEEGKAIKVDEIRKLAQFASKTAQQGGWRVALVAPVESMNLNAANAILKTLEEPGNSTLLLLVSHQPSAVLATVRSRCRLLNMAIPSRAEVVPWLAEATGGNVHNVEMLEQAGGRPMRALRLLQGDLLAQYQQFASTLSGLQDGTLSAIGAAQKIQALTDTETLPWFQQHVYRLIQDAGRGDLSGRRLDFLFLDRLTHCKRLLSGTGNPNRQLLWEELLLDWQAVISADRR